MTNRDGNFKFPRSQKVPQAKNERHQIEQSQVCTQEARSMCGETRSPIRESEEDSKLSGQLEATFLKLQMARDHHVGPRNHYQANS